MAMVRQIPGSAQAEQLGSRDLWFEMSGARRSMRTAADPLNIVVKTGRLDVRRNLFTIRVIEKWNAIPAELKVMKNTGTARFRAQYRYLRTAESADTKRLMRAEDET